MPCVSHKEEPSTQATGTATPAGTSIMGLLEGLGFLTDWHFRWFLGCSWELKSVTGERSVASTGPCKLPHRIMEMCF